MISDTKYSLDSATQYGSPQTYQECVTECTSSLLDNQLSHSHLLSWQSGQGLQTEIQSMGQL